MEWKHKSTPCMDNSTLANAVQGNVPLQRQERLVSHSSPTHVDMDLREVYFLILHFLSTGPCERTFGHLRDEILEKGLLPRRYHSWWSRSGTCSGRTDDDGISLPLNYDNLVERYPHIEKDHLVKLLKQLILNPPLPSHMRVEGNTPSAADVPTLLGSGNFSLVEHKIMESHKARHVATYLRWPHMHADQVRGLSLREIGGGFRKHHRAPSIISACHAIAKPSTMVQKMQNIKKLRGHRNAVYCAIFDRSGRYVITGSDDRLVKIWSMETALCLASCRGHEGDITDLAVSSNNALVASASNDFVIRVWRLPDGMPISVLRGHTGAVTAIAFSPRQASVYQLLSSSDDGTCRIWDARYSQWLPRIYVPSPSDAGTGKNNFTSNAASTSNASQSHQILCCAYNANGTIFVTGSSDSNARVWSASKPNVDDAEQPTHELDVLRGHENDVNYVQFSGCAVAPRSSTAETLKEDSYPKFKNSWFCHDNIVTCSRDGSAIIWTPRSRKFHGKSGRWMKGYHLKVPPPPLPPQPPRGGPRQRFLPTPRGVNMIIWSLDNRFVLAAIMDCRICVWNAADGSLVHCLTGHSESSYVLDVHPSNPRIAMSAGYDGKTIIWDIWEGIPIKVYEIGRFKLVDGKFSQDGTSIVLSDEVGQIYFLNTGQGESQKDAKYDQFFLGDYRPLIRDTNGHVLDQETQLLPHRRNLQDLLCDSSMIPYPEPDQTKFQQRRLGALGVEWRPSSIKFSVGPDFNLGQDYIMPPLADLDRLIEPLPEFIDAMYWEPPEHEVLSDDNDSEYNAEVSSDGARASPCSNSSNELECSSEDSDVENIHENSYHRKRRRKHPSAEVATSSGRRDKRILDEIDSSKFGTKRTKNRRIGVKASKRRYTDVKASRPQRAAAQNARSLLSKISGSSSDEADDSYSSESDRSASPLQQLEKPSHMLETLSNDKQKKRLIVKISVKKPIDSVESKRDVLNQADLEHIPSKSLEENHKVVGIYSGEPGSSSVDAKGTSWCQDMPHSMNTREREKAESQLIRSSDQDQSMCKWREEIPVCESAELTASENNEEAQTYNGDEDISRVPLSGHLRHCDMDTSMEAEEVVPKKVRRLRLKLRDPSSPLKLEPNEVADEFTDGGDGFASIDPSSMNPVMDSEPVIDNLRSSPAHDFEFGEATADVIRRKRSTRLKATSSQSGVRNSVLRVRSGSGSVDKVKKQGIPSTSAYDGPSLEELPSTSRAGSRSRSASAIASKQSVNSGIRLNNVSKKISWLMLSEHEEGCRYIPQLGDEVVYFKQGHQEFLTTRELNDTDRSRHLPRNLGVVEICKVEKLNYDTYPGSGESCCKMTLRVLDSSSSHASRKEFQLTLPDLINFPDFIVEKTRYDAAIKTNWEVGDVCRVWWRDESGEGGSWWEGKIESSQVKSTDFPNSPWERYKVVYETGDKNLHSPWEFDNPQFPWENSTMDEEPREKLLSLFAGLVKSISKHQDSYGIQKLNEAAQKMDFCNRFPVPLYPELIHQRVENQYYRSMGSFKHDVDAMLSNAESYFATNAHMRSKIKRLRDKITKTLRKVLQS